MNGFEIDRETDAFEAWWPSVGQTLGKVAAKLAWLARASPPAAVEVVPACVDLLREALEYIPMPTGSNAKRFRRLVDIRSRIEETLADAPPTQGAGVDYNVIRDAVDKASPRWGGEHDNPQLHKLHFQEREWIAGCVFAALTAPPTQGAGVDEAWASGDIDPPTGVDVIAVWSQEGEFPPEVELAGIPKNGNPEKQWFNAYGPCSKPDKWTHVPDGTWDRDALAGQPKGEVDD